MILLDNKIVIDNDGNTDVANSFEWGDGTNDLSVKVLAGSRIDIDGYVYHNPSA